MDSGRSIIRNGFSVIRNWFPLIFIGLIAATAWVFYSRNKSIEHFSSVSKYGARCPSDYTFFNDVRGDSFCCAGSVDPYTHKCMSSGYYGLCAMKPNMQDPNKDYVSILPLCSEMIGSQREKGEYNCPGLLPHYAPIGKCCKKDPEADDADAEDCLPEDNADVNRYCIIDTQTSGPLQGGEQLCSNLKIGDTAKCPEGYGFDKFQYTLGEREVRKYGNVANGIKLPVCFGMDRTCIPDAAVEHLKKKGVFTDKNPESWAYACSGWTTLNVIKDMTKPMDRNYV